MNTILFRGLTCSHKIWVYGYLVESHHSFHNRGHHKSWILNSPVSNGGWLCLRGRWAVIDSSVGQYSGLKDVDGRMIFDGDIVLCKYSSSFNKNKTYKEKFEVIQNGVEWRIQNKKSYLELSLAAIAYDMKVVGNIHENKLENYG